MPNSPMRSAPLLQWGKGKPRCRGRPHVLWPATGGPAEPLVICKLEGRLLLLLPLRLRPVLAQQSCCQHLRFSRTGPVLSPDQLVHQHIGLGQAAEADAAIQPWNRAGTGSEARASSGSWFGASYIQGAAQQLLHSR